MRVYEKINSGVAIKLNIQKGGSHSENGRATPHLFPTGLCSRDDRYRLSVLSSET